MPFDFTVEHMEPGHVRMRLLFDAKQLRPGNTIAGPVMFTLADTALFALVMSVAGWQPMAATTDMNLHFLRRPEPRDMVAEARILRAGGRLVVGEIKIFSGEGDEPVAHATGTYALPSTTRRASTPK